MRPGAERGKPIGFRLTTLNSGRGVVVAAALDRTFAAFEKTRQDLQ
jgi:hypothetical protein